MAVFADLTPASQKELWAVLALRHAEGIGPRRARRLIRFFGSALDAVEQGLADPAAWKGLVTPKARTAFAAGNWRKSAKLEWEAVRGGLFNFLLPSDPDFPESLENIEDPPLLIYFLGDCSLLRGPAVAVVGARNCIREGMALTAHMARDLSLAGVTVVSGMAKGIDRAAHLAAMQGPGRSIAVLGTGVDVPYPPVNSDVYAMLIAGGLVLSEFAPGVTARPAHFPVRNRLISGLSQGVLVTQAARRSGSLITARLALEQNKSVFAAPGHPFSAESAGCNELIRDGAIPVFKADDILVDLAPLLALEARKALAQRRAYDTARQKPIARDKNKEPYLDELREARVLLPEGALPWLAPTPAQTRDTARKFASARAEQDALAGAKRGLPPETILAAPAANEPALTARPAKKRAAASVVRPGNGGPAVSLDADERALLGALADGPVHIDILCRRLGREVAALSGGLIMLEVRGLVRREPGMHYRLTGRNGA